VAYGLRSKPLTDFLSRYFDTASTPFKAGILALALIGMTPFVVAADQKASANPCNLSEADFAGLNGDFSADVRAINSFKSTIARLLKEERFQELDCIADHARSGKERLPGGDWKLHALYGGLYSPNQYPVTRATGVEWNAHLQRLQQWVAARPESVTARVALARSYLNYAYDARGQGLSNTVSDSGWTLFRERTSEARRILEEAKHLSIKCPEWYLAMLLVAQNEGWSASDARALFEEAFKLEAGYFYDARVLADYLQPKWAGEEGDTAKFMQEIADRIGGDQGDIVYFEVATVLICGCDDEPHLSMERIVRGFEASERQYGVSMLNLNLIAHLATNNKETDPVTADKVFARIGDQWDEQTWDKKEDFDRTKQWAATWAPIVTKTRAIEAKALANMQTPEGARYKVAFEKPYREIVRQCVGNAGTSSGKIEALVSVGTNGTVEDVRIGGPGGMCVYQKLLALQHEKTPVFPPPPQAPYLLKVDLDWAEFPAVAAR
jgi:hypothetical protein